MTTNSKSANTPQTGDLMQDAPLSVTEDMIHAVVHGFYAAIRDDNLVGPLFNRAIPEEMWPHHLAKMCDFWSSVLLRTKRYQGRPLPPHLSIPELDDTHFKRWLSLFRETVTRHCPPDAAALFMDRAFRIAHSFRLAIAFNRNQNTLNVEPLSRNGLSDHA